MNKDKQLSNCCQAPIEVNSADEGTSCYMCTKCNKPCDPMKDKQTAEEIFLTAHKFNTTYYIRVKKEFHTDLVDGLIEWEWKMGQLAKWLWRSQLIEDIPSIDFPERDETGIVIDIGETMTVRTFLGTFIENVTEKEWNRNQ